MGDVAVLEAAQHMDDGVDLADIGEELVAQPLALGRAAHKSGDIDELQRGRHDFRGLADCGEHIQPFVGDRDASDIRFDRAERIVRRLRRGGGSQRVEQSGLADVRQPNNTAIETHAGVPDGPIGAVIRATVSGAIAEVRGSVRAPR